jgi:L-threonylcarbamoyladenylate synthase
MITLQTRIATARFLTDGGIVLMPTDTVWGFHCRADRPEALKRMRRLKKRSVNRPFLMLASSHRQAFRLVRCADRRVLAYARACWPGPYTLILPGGMDLEAEVRAERGTVAVRVPAWETLRKLVAMAGYPLASTSANVAHRAPCRNLESALELFGAGIEAVAELRSGSQGMPMLGRSSALIDVTRWPPRLRRAGPSPMPDWSAG